MCLADALSQIGAFVGGYAFPALEKAGGSPDSLNYGRYPVYVASALCFVSAFLVYWLPNIDQDTIEKEDRRFRDYLVANGYDISGMGNEVWQEKRRRESKTDEDQVAY